MTNVFMVFLGGGIGCALRYGAGLVVTSTMFPLATFVVNVIGSMAIGLFSGWASRFGWSEGYGGLWREVLARAVRRCDAGRSGFSAM